MSKTIDQQEGYPTTIILGERRRLYMLLRLAGFTVWVSRQLRDWTLKRVRGQLSAKVGARVANRALALFLIEEKHGPEVAAAEVEEAHKGAVQGFLVLERESELMSDVVQDLEQLLGDPATYSVGGTATAIIGKVRMATAEQHRLYREQA